ncbi:TPA: DUF551 domain-containing protein [Klebsiella quasipneumoniae]
MSIDKQYLREVAKQATGAHERINAISADDIFDISLHHDGAQLDADIPAKLRRAAMLQAGTLTNESTIPVTQFKPVADLYGLTSPTGSETSFTFDAVEARDFIDGGWSCQEYVELERFHEAITNHTEDKLAMVDHSGDSNNMVEPVTTTYKLPFEQWLSKQTGTIDVEYGCVMTEVFFHWLRVAYDAGNSPVIPDGWTGNDKANAALMMLDRIETVDPVDDDRIDGIKRIVRELAAAPHDTPALNSVQSVDSVADRWIPVSERMPDENAEQQVLACFKGGDISTLYYFEGRWDDAYGIVPIRQDVTHWMPLPAAPQEPKP